MDETLVEFALKKAETQEEYDQITEIMNHILDMPDADSNEYISQLWGILQEVVEDYEEKLEEEDDEEDSSEVEEKVEETVEPTVDPSRIAFRGKKVLPPVPPIT